MPRVALSAGLLTLLAACGQVGHAGDASLPDSPAIAATATLALTADGMVQSSEGETPASFAFGTPRATIEGIVERIAGAATDRSHNDECGAGPMDFTDYGALTLNFQDDSFVGWFADSGTRVPTVDGVLPGITRAELENGRSVTLIADSTLVGEFEYALPDGSPIGGFFDGSAPESRVTALYAGTNCFFR